MSLSESVELSCPKCGCREDAVILKSINVDLNPEMRSQLFNGEINHFTCSQCGFDAVINCGLLYHDMTHNFMILLDIDEEPLENIVKDLDISLEFLSNDYKLRVVRSLRQMIEKIVVFESGLDDRIVEFNKYSIRIQKPRFRNKHPDFILFDGIEDADGNHLLTYVVFDEKTNKGTPLFVDMAAYLDIEKTVREFLPEKGRSLAWEEVNLSYVSDLMSS